MIDGEENIGQLFPGEVQAVNKKKERSVWALQPSREVLLRQLRRKYGHLPTPQQNFSLSGDPW